MLVEGNLEEIASLAIIQKHQLKCDSKPALVPKCSGTGRRNVLGGITKRGNTYLRSLLVHGAKIEEMQRTVGHSQIKTTQMYDRRSFKYEESASFKVWY
jgi:hypothetical protein